jgi:AAA15 family ATPase/GTPase
MLIRFAVQNHLSIRDRQELSFVASPLKDDGVDLISYHDESLLPAALIYGANASGKSNLISAITYFRDMVRYSHSRNEATGAIPRKPFALEKKSKNDPTSFELDFVQKGIRYHYGVSFSSAEILEERLYAFPYGKRQVWYLRNRDKKRIYFGKYLKGETKLIESITRPNSLFLSAAAQNSHKQLSALYEYIGAIEIIAPSIDLPTTAMGFAEGKIDSRIITFLKNADTGIVDCKFDDLIRDKRGSEFVSDLVQVFKKHDSSADFTVEDLQAKVISLGHQAKDSGKIYLDMASESTGTVRLLSLLRAVYSALDRGATIVVDELDASLHTYLTEKIVSLFAAKETNKKSAQLLATTHDTNLLSARCLRRDQIWFAEKGSSGATVIYPLTDMRTRNTDNLERGYLQGRFGAVPFSGSVKSLLNVR